jgi:hypothetical protein
VPRTWADSNKPGIIPDHNFVIDPDYLTGAELQRHLHLLIVNQILTVPRPSTQITWLDLNYNDTFIFLLLTRHLSAQVFLNQQSFTWRPAVRKSAGLSLF